MTVQADRLSDWKLLISGAESSKELSIVKSSPLAVALYSRLPKDMQSEADRFLEQRTAELRR